MNFGIIFYDLILLALFLIGVIVFLYINRKKVIREGLLYLYKTSLGLKIIDKLGKKYKKTLKFLSYCSVIIGYLLMIFFTYYLIKTVYYYIKYPIITELIKAPPLMLLIPYFPKIFGAQEFFPEFYFIYFLVAIAIVAIVHEGAHGVFARYYNIRIKSTGFGFLGPILAFFVEQDDKQMQKAKIFPQLSILSAGVFANILVAIVFLVGLVLFFNFSYTPYGVEFSNYGYISLPVSVVSQATLLNQTLEIENINLTKIQIENTNYYATPEVFEIDFDQHNPNALIQLYQDQPAINAKMKGIIIKIGNIPVKNGLELRKELNNYNVGDNLIVTTDYHDELISYNISLGASPLNESEPVLGVVLGSKNQLSTFRIIEFFKKPGVYYKSNYNPELANFFYYLIGWIVLINILVALFNMLPVGIFY